MRIHIPKVVGVVSMDISKAYEELKRLLRENKCRIVEEEPPSKIIVEHGSAFGFSPTSIEKVATFHLVPVDSKTRIIAETSLTSDSKTRLIGVVLENIAILFIVGMLVYAFTDLLSTLSSLRIWLLGEAIAKVELYVSMLNILFVILILVTVIAIVFFIYSYWKRDSFAENILKLLSLLH
jgi:hypothetical protein